VLQAQPLAVVDQRDRLHVPPQLREAGAEQRYVGAERREV